MTDYSSLLRALAGHEVEFVLVGGAAATAHGSARLTLDIDILYARSAANIQRIVDALAPFSPYLRDAPPGLPFKFDADTVLRGLNFTLTTSAGDIDLLGEIAGGNYDSLCNDAIVIDLFGVQCRCLSLEQLIRVKRAAGRPKDLDAVAELEAILEERGKER